MVSRSSIAAAVITGVVLLSWGFMSKSGALVGSLPSFRSNTAIVALNGGEKASSLSTPSSKPNLGITNSLPADPREFHPTFAREYDRDAVDCPQHKRFRDDNVVHPLTALYSFPGSGNTWIRLMLENATGTASSASACTTNTR